MTVDPSFSSSLQLASTTSRASPVTSKEQDIAAISYILYQWLMKITYSQWNNKIIQKSQYIRVQRHNIGRRTFFIDKQMSWYYNPQSDTSAPLLAKDIEFAAPRYLKENHQHNFLL